MPAPPTGIAADTTPAPWRASDYAMEWSVADRRFRFETGRSRSDLVLPDGEIIGLSNVEWAAVADAIRVMVKKGARRQSPLKPVSEKERGPSTGARWTEGHDAMLVHMWNDGNATIGDLMKALDRNEGAITSRLVRLGIVASRDEAQTESGRRGRAAG